MSDINGGLSSHDDLDGVDPDDHHARDHASRHESGGADALTLGNLASMDATAVLIDTSTNRPAAGTSDRVFIETDTGRILRDNGTSWVEMGLSESQISLANLGSRSHSDLSGVSSNDHHTKYSPSSVTSGSVSTSAGYALWNIDGDPDHLVELYDFKGNNSIGTIHNVGSTFNPLTVEIGTTSDGYDYEVKRL